MTNSFEKVLSIFEVEQTHERIRLHQITEEELGIVIRGDSAWHQATRTALGGELVSHALGEDGIKVDVPTAAERIEVAVPYQLGLAFSLSKSVLKLCV